MIKNLALVLVLLSAVGCSTFSDRYQDDTKLIISYLLYDLPLPATAEIQKSQTVILGTGGGWAGRIALSATESPAELLKFFSQSTVGSGWTMTASTVSDQIILVFGKESRVATIEIFRNSFLEGMSMLGGRQTDVTISVHHPNAVQSQSPFDGYKAPQGQ